MIMKNIVVVDIDGTIANIKHRLHLITEDYDLFNAECKNDLPINEIIELVTMLSLNYKIVFCSGRDEICRKDTIEWLKKFFDEKFIDSVLILLRPANEMRADFVMKPELLLQNNILFNKIIFVLEDRNSVVKRWRQLGIKCLQVAEGNF